MNPKQYMAASVEMGCIICLAPAIPHHPRKAAAGAGMGKKAKDENSYPLCFNHHTGKQGIHKLGARTWESIYGTELSLWNRNRARLGMEQLEDWL